MTLLVLLPRSTPARFVASSLRRCLSRRLGAGGLLRYCDSPLSNRDLLFASLQFLVPFGELRLPGGDPGLPYLEHLGKPVQILIDNRTQLVVQEDGKTASHGNTDNIAVSSPGRPHRIRHRDLHQLHPVGVIQFGTQPAIHFGQKPAVQDRLTRRRELPYTVASLRMRVYGFTAIQLVATV